ncbi:hypothetical protein BVY04_02930 [bacterium M21]|nr:hypothetical protein BVY04_02930 [bacterium M21]
MSKNGNYNLILQDDGNFVLYDHSGKALWSSGTNNLPIEKCIMQGDGNLVLYRDDGKAAWASDTRGKTDTNLIIQNDGNAVIYYNQNPEAIWATGPLVQRLNDHEGHWTPSRKMNNADSTPQPKPNFHR